jgi:hypothetical protein
MKGSCLCGDVQFELSGQVEFKAPWFEIADSLPRSARQANG